MPNHRPGRVGLVFSVVEGVLLFGDEPVRFSGIVGAGWQRLGTRPLQGRSRRARGNFMQQRSTTDVTPALHGSLDGVLA